MKKNSLKVLSVIGASIIPFAITPLIVSCSKNEEDLSNVKMYDKNYRILFNGAGEILDYDGNATELEIPEYLENNGTTSSSYYGKKIKVSGIGSNAFKWDEKEDSGRSKLQKITLPDSVTWIGDYAFDNNQLTQVTIPDSVKYLSGFDGTKITNINIPNSVTEIGDYAFKSTNLTQVTIPDSVTEIGYEAFYNTNIKEVTLPEKCYYYKNSFSNSCKITGGIIKQ